MATSSEIYEAFNKEHLSLKKPLDVVEVEFEYIKSIPRTLRCSATVEFEGKSIEVEGEGNGPISAFVHALKKKEILRLTLTEVTYNIFRNFNFG